MSSSYAVSFRLRRITTETAHVSVPLTAEMWRPSDDDPKRMTVDTDKVAAAAIQLGALSVTVWRPDGEAIIEPHPVQTPPAPSRS
jgi:hypothetical protein